MSYCYVNRHDYETYWPEDARQQPEAIVVPAKGDKNFWTPLELVSIFHALIADGLAHGSMDERMAYRWGKKLGHWGLVELADREVRESGWAAIKQLGGEAS